MLDLDAPPRWLRDDPDPVEIRRQALAWLRPAVPYDLALFHALSPRVPLATGAFVGLDPGTLALETWDGLAVSLGRFRDVALQRDGVASDTEVVPARGPVRRQYVETVVRGLGCRHLVLAHLVVAGRIEAVIALGRRRPDPFQASQVDALRRVTPTLAVVDTLAQRLADAPQALRRGSRCVDDRLTPRQREIASLVADGFTNRQIGEALGLSPHTVRNRLADACRRLDVSGRAALVARASFR